MGNIWRTMEEELAMERKRDMGKIKSMLMDAEDKAYQAGYDDAREQFVTNANRVKEFHKVYGLGINKPFSVEDMVLRRKLHKEEHREMEVEYQAIYNNLFLNNIPPSRELKQKFTKEMADLLYVIYGYAITFGIDIDRAFAEVHKSNMSKLGTDGKPIYRKDGKVLKGPNYKEADMSWV